jgi:endonuclease
LLLSDDQWLRIEPVVHGKAGGRSGEFHVFELKRGRTPDHVMGQLTRYMGWVSQTIGVGKTTHGIIVAKQVSDALRYAACVVPNVSLFEYEVSFQLRSASALP